MENPNERNLLRRAELMGKHRHIIAKAAREKELEREEELEKERRLERERELERIVKAKRAAAVREQNDLLIRNENVERVRRRTRGLGITHQPRLAKVVRRASHGAVNTMKKTVEIAEGTSKYPLLMAAMLELYGSRSIFDDVTSPLQLVRSGD